MVYIETFMSVDRLIFTKSANVFRLQLILTF